MKLRLICVGKMSQAPLKALVEDYRDRLKRLCDLEIIEIKDADSSEPLHRLQKEAEKIRALAEPFSECLLLDEKGEMFSSIEFSRKIDTLENAATKRLTLIIGSSHGIDESLKTAIPKKMALSKFTLTHEWARALLLEQIYRAFCIKKNIPYHH